VKFVWLFFELRLSKHSPSWWSLRNQFKSSALSEMTTGAVTERFPESSSEPLLPTNHRRNGSDGGEEAAAFHEFNGASFPGAVFNLSTTIVGAGIMALPATMKVLGLVPGLVMIVLAAFLTDASIELLMRFSRVVGAPSYGAVMGDAFGWWGRRLLQVCVVVNNVGVMIVYMIIIGKIFLATALLCFIQYGIHLQSYLCEV
jgi:sodium-coupled neutral amino acid transporter 2